MFRGDWTRDDALRILQGHDVAFVALKLDGSITVQTWTKSPEKTVHDLVRRLGTTSVEQSFTPHRPGAELPISAWQVMDVLVDEPRRSLRDLCAETHLTPKTVRKHLHNLVLNENIFILPRLGPLTDSGDILYHLSVRGDVRMSELAAVLDDAVLVDAPRNPPIKYLFCRSKDLADVTSKTKAVSKLNGVEAVEVTLNRELTVNSSLMHSLIRKRIRDSGQG